MRFSIRDIFSELDQINRKLQIWSHLLKKSLMENFIFGQWDHQKQGKVNFLKRLNYTKFRENVPNFVNWYLRIIPSIFSCYRFFIRRLSFSFYLVRTRDGAQRHSELCSWGSLGKLRAPAPKRLQFWLHINSSNGPKLTFK